MTFKPTAKDPDGALTGFAIAHLAEAQRTRQHYADLLDAAIATHGDVTSTPISGVYNDKFPETIKVELRTLAHSISVQVDTAYIYWRKAGRRRDTLRPIAQEYRQLKDGRVSYY